MRHADQLLSVGHAMATPAARYAMLDLQPLHLDDGGPFAWTAKAWLSICAVADQDEAERKARPLVAERLHSVCPGVPLERWRQLEQAGRTAASEIEHVDAAHRLIERWQVRRYARAAESIVVWSREFLSGDNGEFGAEVVSRLATEWAQAEQDVQTESPSTDVYTPDDIAGRFTDLHGERQGDPEGAFGLRCGWERWDEVHTGAHTGRVGLTIAPSGSGKTFLMLNLGAGICDPHPWNDYNPPEGLYINNEMEQDDLIVRQTAIRLQRAGFSERSRPFALNEIARGELSDYHAGEAARLHSMSRLHVTGFEDKTASGITALLAQHALRRGIKWACVDHMLDVCMTREEARMSQGVHWKQHAGWLRQWQGVARRYGIALEVVGMVGGSNIIAREGVEPDPYEIQGAKATINRVDVYRLLWQSQGQDNNPGDPIVTTWKNRKGIANARTRFRWIRGVGSFEDRGAYFPPEKEDKR